MHREVGEALAHQAGPPLLPGHSRRRWREEARIQTQAHDEGGHRPHGVEQFQRSVRLVPDDDQATIGHPAVDLPDQLTRPGGQGLVGPSPASGAAFGGGEHRQERQRPHAACPRDGHQEGGADPAQAAHFDEVAPAGAHRVTVDARRGDALAASALDRFIDPHHQRTGRRERRDEHTQQHATGAETRPDRAIQDPMVGLVGGQVAQPYGAERGTHHASARSQDGADEQHLDMPPHRAREQRRERGQACDNVGG